MPRKPKSEKKEIQMSSNPTPGVGLDIGTMNIVAARGGKVRQIRDVFLDLPQEAKQTLRLGEVAFMDTAQGLVVVGDAALTTANLFKREARRPLSRGVISAGELDAQEILSMLIHEVVGKPLVENELCHFSVPSDPIDVEGQDVIYHREVFKKILKNQGYRPVPTNEAMAVIYSQCANDHFSGLAISFGAGMCNVALAYRALSNMEFAVARGGDWVDSQSARAVGKTASQMCAVKEKGVDLSDPQGRQEEAVSFYLRTLIDYALKATAKRFKEVRNDVELPEPIPFIVSGGTSIAKGFLKLFKEQFEEVRSNFPIEISEIRTADDPLNAVAQGLLVLAQADSDED
jgi:hypothetical protein